jgi:hypothetical protein
LDLLSLRDERSTVHKEPVLASGRMFLPSQLAVVDKRIVPVILFHFLLAAFLLSF